MRNSIEMRKANIEDLKFIIQLYKKAIVQMEHCGISQWDDLYPSEEILHQDILKHQMYIGEIDSKIVSVFVLNQEYDEAYNTGNWIYNETSFFIVHRLCVDPVVQGKGVGSMTMLLIEDFLRSKGIESIRLDAFSLNPSALKMYEKFGYMRVGLVNWRKGLFYLYEKKL